MVGRGPSSLSYMGTRLKMSAEQSQTSAPDPSNTRFLVTPPGQRTQQLSRQKHQREHGTAAWLVLGAATPAGRCRRQGQGLPSFPEQPETRLLKQNLLISKCWKSAHLFKNTEWTRETPPASWAAKGHLCSLGWGVWSSRCRGSAFDSFCLREAGGWVHSAQRCPPGYQLPPCSHPVPLMWP